MFECYSICSMKASSNHDFWHSVAFMSLLVCLDPSLNILFNQHDIESIVNVSPVKDLGEFEIRNDEMFILFCCWGYDIKMVKLIAFQNKLSYSYGGPLDRHLNI